MIANPFFSILVPVYNRPELVHVCLDSIIMQSFKDFELVIVDDGSDYETHDLLEKYAQEDSRIRLVVHSENKGIVISRDDAILNSTGEYIIWIDSDDYIDQGRLECIHNLLIENNTDVIITSYIHEYAKKHCRIFRDTIPCGVYKDKEYSELRFKTMKFNKRTGMRYIHSILWNKVFRRNLMVATVNRIDCTITIGDDIPRTYLGLFLSKSVMIVDLPSYHYVQSENQTMKNYHPGIQWNRALKIYDSLGKAAMDFDFSLEVNEIINQNLCYDAVTTAFAECENTEISNISENLKQISDSSRLRTASIGAKKSDIALYIRFILILLKRHHFIVLYYIARLFSFFNS